MVMVASKCGVEHGDEDFGDFLSGFGSFFKPEMINI